MGYLHYQRADDLWVVTSYFNREKYASVAENLRRFREPLARAGQNFLAVECAFGSAPFDLEPAPDLLQVRARDVLWQKERLLNVAISRLPPACRKVAWLDCDVLFENPDWAVEASRLLDDHPVVQLYDRAVRLPRGHTRHRGEGDAWDGFAAVHRRAPHLHREGRFGRHGHTGFAWAARREILGRHGLYDPCIAGSSDHLMAHAMYGDCDSHCVRLITGIGNRQHAHFLGWFRGFSRDVAGRVAHVPGRVLHLWHGEMADRNYLERHQELLRFDFDPGEDLKVGAGGCWEWNSPKPDLHRWAADYFRRRNEDGVEARPTPGPPSMPTTADGQG
jgi:hypothetical protein